MEDDNRKDGSEPPIRGGAAPQPPATYRPQEGPGQPQGGFPRTPPELDSAKRMVNAAQIMALVSLVIGGVVLSTASVVVAAMAYRKALACSESAGQSAAASWEALKRSAVLAIVVSVLALAVNVIALMTIYPMVMDMLQSGDYASLWNGSGEAPPSSSSFWG